jgi:hypothetical protein
MKIAPLSLIEQTKGRIGGQVSLIKIQSHNANSCDNRTDICQLTCSITSNVNMDRTLADRTDESVPPCCRLERSFEFAAIISPAFAKAEREFLNDMITEIDHCPAG